ncbi:MAG: undecaprenyl-diphosphate phosphatase, partial [Thermodesulfobacteriota bacterium]|nr:undecaprenyl-diphosphate phosphatase [Thermodesulfobacteriota bacterium]
MLLKVVILSLLEGFTEFLPVSSTGHLIILSDFLKFNGEFAKSFNIIIQMGA